MVALGQNARWHISSHVHNATTDRSDRPARMGAHAGIGSRQSLSGFDALKRSTEFV